jgi:hypothetical protein
MADTEMVTIEIDTDGSSDELTVPAGLLDLIRDGEQSDAAVLGDVALLSFASRTHHLTHHGDGDPTDEILAIEEATMDAFEDRFGMTFEEATGHEH